MPTLDVNDAFDPSFYDDIVVIRRAAVINNKGRVTTTNTSTSTRAVVTAASPSDLARLPEAEYMGKAISIYTPYRLQGPARDEAGAETMPDQVLWPTDGSVYVVRFLEDYSGYGRGFVHAVAVSVAAVDPAPIPQPVGSA